MGFELADGSMDYHVWKIAPGKTVDRWHLGSLMMACRMLAFKSSRRDRLCFLRVQDFAEERSEILSTAKSREPVSLKRPLSRDPGGERRKRGKPVGDQLHNERRGDQLPTNDYKDSS